MPINKSEKEKEKEKEIELSPNADPCNIDLPPEILYQIFSFVETQGIDRIFLTSKSCKDLLQSDKNRWKKLIDEYLPWLSTTRNEEYQDNPYQLFTSVLFNLLNKDPLHANAFSFRTEQVQRTEAVLGVTLFDHSKKVGETPQFKQYLLPYLKGQLADNENSQANLNQSDEIQLLQIAAACGHGIAFLQAQQYLMLPILLYACLIGNKDIVVRLRNEMQLLDVDAINAIYICFFTGNFQIAEYLIFLNKLHQTGHMVTFLNIAIECGAISFITKMIDSQKEAFLDKKGHFIKDLLTTAFESNPAIATLLIDSFEGAATYASKCRNNPKKQALVQQFDLFRNQQQGATQTERKDSTNPPEDEKTQKMGPLL